MNVGKNVLIRYGIAVAMLLVVWMGFANNLPNSFHASSSPIQPVSKDIVLDPDTGEVELPLPHGGEDPNNPTETPGGVSLAWPDNFNYSVEYDAETGRYVVYQTIGDSIRFRMPTTYSLEEYLELKEQENVTAYWN